MDGLKRNLRYERIYLMKGGEAMEQEQKWIRAIQRRNSRDAAEDFLRRDPDLATCPAAAERAADLFARAADTLN